MVPDEPALHDYASGPVTRAVRRLVRSGMPVVYIGPRYTRGDHAHDVLMSHVCGNPCKTRCRWNTYIADTVNTLTRGLSLTPSRRAANESRWRFG